MARPEKEPMQKHTLNLYEGDFERLQALYPELGASIVIRKIIRKHIESITPDVNAIKSKEVAL